MGLENTPQPAKIPEKAKTKEELGLKLAENKKKIEDGSQQERKDLLKEMGLGEIVEGIFDCFNQLFLGDSEIMKNFWKEILGDDDDSSDGTDSSSASVSTGASGEKITKKSSKKGGKVEKIRGSKSALEALEAALKVNPEWKNHLNEAYELFHIEPEVTASIMYLESGFKRKAKNPDSGAAGLGQFIPGTWKMFIKANPQFAGKDQYDARASICATAWYCRQNADHLGIDMNAPDAVAKIYEAHHNGEQGYRDMEDFRSGRKLSLRVPKSYAAAGYNTPQKYTDHITKLAQGVQKTSESFAPLLS